MPNVIRNPYSNTAGNTPSSLGNGVLAVNQADGRLFFRSAAGVVTTFSSIASYATTSSFPAVGLANLLYVASDSSRAYQFAGGFYIEIGVTGGSGGGGTATTSASDLTSGTLDDARLSGNVILASAFAATTNQATNFIEPIDRQALTISPGLVNTAQYWSFFTPAYPLTITQISYSCAGAASGLTLCRFGLYTMNAAGAGNLVARTANDTTCFNASNTIFTRTLDATGGYVSSYSLVAGQRYAVSVAVAGTGNMGSLNGSACPNHLAVLTPRVQGARTGVSDLVTSQGSGQYNGSVGHIYWARLS